VTLYQVDYEFRFPYVENPDGYYYWTNAFYVEQTTPIAAITSCNGRLSNIVHHTCLLGVECTGHQVHTPPGSGDVVYVDPGSTLAGSLSPIGVGPLINSVHILFLAAGSVVGWKRWRVPLRTSDIDGDYIATAFWLDLQDYWSGALSSPVLRSRTGVLIDEILVDRKIHMWQLRHGTKRRSRPVIVYP